MILKINFYVSAFAKNMPIHRNGKKVTN